jgi:uncharacterized protein (TIGR02145 family)
MKNTIRISRMILVILPIFLIYSCKKDKPEPPVITTTAASAISYTTATSGGMVTNEGGAPVTARGVCWNTSAEPTTTNSKTTNGTGSGSFTSSLSGLTAGTTYYVRAYATNIAGTGYGSQVTLTTIPLAVPVLTTTAISAITQTTAASGGNITTDNGSSVTARGICWGTDINPTTGNSKTSDATGTGVFTSTMTGLTGNTTYYVRAYATNSVGTEYGNQVSFKTSPLMPVLSTAVVTSISYTTATSGGTVTNDGGASVTARGVCWNTSADPTTANNKTTDGPGTGSFVSTLIGLQPGTNYYVRAYATNSVGTSYGNQVTLTTIQVANPVLTTTAISSITQTTAVSGGNITADNGAAISARGVCWGTEINPTTGNSKTSDETGTGLFTSTLTGLAGNTTYYVRAYAINSVGTEYGNQVSFKTSPVIPALSTTIISSITQNTAAGGGNVTSDGGASVAAKGICWSTSADPTVSLSTKTTDGTGTGSFVSNLIGLTPNTTYYVRAYATNSAGTGYGNQVTFTTSQIALAALTTTAITSITQTTALSGGNITTDNGAAITARGICWGTDVNPTISNNKTSDATGAGVFTSTLIGLAGNTTYYVRAYATNSVGTEYGNQVIFKTSPLKPSLSTTAISSVTQTTATSGGNVTSDGGATVTARGVCWSTSADPTVALSTKTTDGTGTGIFTSLITGLIHSTTYYVRAYATNSAGTEYGSTILFTTQRGIIFNPLKTYGSLTDIEGNVYKTITIGTQTWMAENLKTIKYNDGTAIPLVTDAAWGTMTTPAYCWYNNDAAYKDTYGAMYNWYTVNTGKLCPSGWHVPTDAEWTILTTYLGGVSVAGGKLKETGTTHWSINTGADNETGFTAVPGGGRGDNGMFDLIEDISATWSSTESNSLEALLLYLGGGTSIVGIDYREKFLGLSVRCLSGGLDLPVLSTTSISGISGISAVSGGNISSQGGSSVTARGVCWSTSSTPTIYTSKTTNGSGAGSFTGNLTGLSGNTTYYVRSYATNNQGTAYGAQVSFTTPVLPVTTINFVDDGTGYFQFYTNDVANLAQSGGRGYFYINTTNYAPFNSVETEVIKNSGSLFMFGIVFCYSDGNNYYRFLIGTNGSYEILKIVAGAYSWYNFNTSSWQGNSSFNYPISTRLNTGYGVSNKIKVIATGGGKFDLYFNGTKEASFTDTNLTTGKTGFNAYVGTSLFENFPNTPVDVRFKQISAN